MIDQLVKKPVFWIAILLVSAACLFGVLRFFGDAFSVLDLDVRMSRSMAIDEARRLSDAKHLSEATLSEAVASFDGNEAAQTFIELEGGGKPALKPFVDTSAATPGEAGEFTLYRWRVRLFSPQVEREVQIAFTPDGRPTGFFSRIPEKDPGAALSAGTARALAVAAAARDWAVDFARYRPLTASATTRPGGRVDHEFVYERLLDDAPPIGDGRLRLRLVVSGDRLTQLQRFVYVPEAFTRRYETMRSANNTIAAGAGVVAGLVYGLGGCLVGLIWLMRRHAVQWKPAAKWAGVVALLGTGAALAAISGSWIGYDTATSPTIHRISGIGIALVGGVVTWLLLTVVFAAAEGLSRLAFGSHPQLWRTWCAPSAYSRAVWGRTLAGYAWIGFDLAFIALFYFVVQRWLGWWSPSDALIDPNILGTPQPWLAPVSKALQAGMMEEALFRAIPLAGAALLGRHFGRERTFVLVALVLQAIVFGCAHANYPGQPAYARPIELFLPSLIWGIVYLRYGLVPGMLFHFGFDLVLMSIPLFVTAAPGIWFDRTMVVGILAIPLLVLVVQWRRSGRLVDLPDAERNAAAASASPSGAGGDGAWARGVTTGTPAMQRILVARLTGRDGTVLALCALVGLVGVAMRIARPMDAPGLSIDRAQAMAIAERALVDRGVRLDERWRRSASAVGVGDVDFVWHEGGAPLFARLLGGTLAPPHWEVRFARFDGDVVERDAWRVSVVDDRPAPDGVRIIEHDLPESRVGKRLTEAEARPIAEAAIASWLKRAPTALRRISASAAERPTRIDWDFVYADPDIVLPAGGEARVVVTIAGDEVAAVGRTVFVPDAWRREQRTRDDARRIPRALLGIVGLAFAILMLVSLVRRIARGALSKRAAWTGGALFAATTSITMWLRLGAVQSGFSIAQPFDAQMLRFTLQWAGAVVAGGLFAAMIAGAGVRLASRVDVAAGAADDADRTHWRRWLAPVALALLAAGYGGIVALFGPAPGPREPAVGVAASWLPIVSAAIDQLAFVVPASIALLVAATLSVRGRRIEAALAVAVVVVAILARLGSPESTVVSVIVAGVGAGIAWLLFRGQVRDRPWIVAPTLLCLAILDAIVALAFDAYPGSRAAAIATIVVALVGYRIWCRLVARDRAAP